MSEQGKLKEQFKKNTYYYEYEQEEFDKVIDEAKADFPKMYQPQPNIMEFYRWFKKYFGEGKP